MIHYEEIEPYLIDFLHGEVAEEIEYRVRAYLQQNPDFQQELDELEETLTFSHHTPLVQPAPELKMNFYAMLNEYKATQDIARPSFRERMKQFLQTQFYWQTLSIGVFAVLVSVIGFWGVSVFQERFKNTEVALHKIEIEQQEKVTATFIDIEMPKRKNAIAKNNLTENAATQGPEADDLNLLEPKTIEKKSIAEDKNSYTNIGKNNYSFADSKQAGKVTINNPNGNINLMGYAGKEVKIETMPAQSYAGVVDNNHVIIDGISAAPQIDMQVLLPQNRLLQISVTAQQNITMDLRGVELETNSSLTSQGGNVEVRVAEDTSLEINALAREIENDFGDAPNPFEYNKNINAQSNEGIGREDEKEIASKNDVNQSNLKLKDAKSSPKEHTRVPQKRKKEAKSENMARTKSADISKQEEAKTRISPTYPPVLQVVKVPLKNSKNTLQLNSPKGKAKIKKSNK